LGFIPNHVVDKTLSAMMQMVDTIEAETREHMRDHLVSQLPELKVHHVNEEDGSVWFELEDGKMLCHTCANYNNSRGQGVR
jgi:hypothetical protein